MRGLEPGVSDAKTLDLPLASLSVKSNAFLPPPPPPDAHPILQNGNLSLAGAKLPRQSAGDMALPGLQRAKGWAGLGSAGGKGPRGSQEARDDAQNGDK